MNVRVYMRNVLQNHGDMSFLSADALDGSRLYRMVNGYIYENADGYEFFCQTIKSLRRKQSSGGSVL